MYAYILFLVSEVIKILEKELETKFKRKVEKELPAKVFKFVSPGASGVPDRIILMSGRCIFAEIKRPGGKLRALQRFRKRQLEKLDCPVWVIDSEEKIEEFINAYKV